MESMRASVGVFFLPRKFFLFFRFGQSLFPLTCLFYLKSLLTFESYGSQSEGREERRVEKKRGTAASSDYGGHLFLLSPVGWLVRLLYKNYKHHCHNITRHNTTTPSFRNSSKPQYYTEGTLVKEKKERIIHSAVTAKHDHNITW